MKIMDWIKYNESVDEHSYFIPTYNQCREICDANDNFLFFETIHEVDGYKISIFSYRLARASDFACPVTKNPKLKAHEVRGITFVFNLDGSLFKRFLMLDKFWNMDQEETSMYSVIKDYKIKSIYEKEDGSIASFIKLPNGKSVARSKASFISDQAIEIQRIYNEWKNIKKFVDWCLNNEIIPIFEYVAPTNRIVIKYSNPDLILLRMRDNTTGKYLDINDYTDMLDGITVAKVYNEYTLDNLIELKDVIEGKEGWIVQFENGKMIKIKTEYYKRLHGLFTDDINRENTLINLIINEKIDDVLSQIDDEDKKKEIERISDIINNYIRKASDIIDDLMIKYTGDRKDFAIRYRKQKFFPICMQIINMKVDKIQAIKDKILKDTSHLVQAKNWVRDNA